MTVDDAGKNGRILTPAFSRVRCRSRLPVSVASKKAFSVQDSVVRPLGKPRRRKPEVSATTACRSNGNTVSCGSWREREKSRTARRAKSEHGINN
jgi:hypothetical protein